MKKFYLLITSILFLHLTTIQAQTVSTYAGTPEFSGNTSVPVHRSSAKFYRPHGIEYDSKGNMWIAEKTNCVITMIMASNEEVRIRVGGIAQASFMDGSGVVSRFNNPGGIAIGPDDEIYVADVDNHVIRKISPYLNLGNAQEVSVYAGKHTIKPGAYSAHAGYANGSAMHAQFMFPTDVACDAIGNVYVADKGNQVIRKIDTSGMVTTFAGQAGVVGSQDGPVASASFNTPAGVFCKGNDVYVADQLNSKIRKISGGQVTTVISNLWTPTDVYVDDQNDIYVIDLHRVWKFNVTYAGSSQPMMHGYLDANGTEARFKTIMGITKYGKSLFVADQDNHVIRRITDCTGWSASISRNKNTLTANMGISYQWFKDGTKINGATNQSYQVSETATYTVSVENTDGCLATAADIFVEYVSVNEKISLNSMSAFPNPFNDYLDIQAEFNQQTNGILRIMDMTGKSVYSQTFSGQTIEKHIQLSELKKGFYILEVFSEQGHMKYKLSKM
jgi:hypothetical protein